MFEVLRITFARLLVGHKFYVCSAGRGNPIGWSSVMLDLFCWMRGIGHGLLVA